MPESVKLSPRLQSLFAKTKLVCFGRYAIEVPLEAQLIIGTVGAPSDVSVIEGGLEINKLQIAADIAKIKDRHDTAEITYNGIGPVEASWQLRYYENEFSKKYGSLFFKTYVEKGERTFFYGGAIHDDNDNEASATGRQASLARNLRLREPDEVPSEPGFCVKRGFVANNFYAEQEMASAGIFLPSLPDVTFSMSSNKDAYGDYPPPRIREIQNRTVAALSHRAGQERPRHALPGPYFAARGQARRAALAWRRVVDQTGGRCARF